MDPDVTLADIRALCADMPDSETTSAADMGAHLAALIDSVEALDEWLSRGGFLPAAWQR